jgi:RNA polymerase sigma-70 factor (ECF subfamily)
MSLQARTLVSAPEVAPLGADLPKTPFELARAAAAGDAVATTHLLQSVAPKMMRVVRAVMGPHASDVDDVVQQALIGLIQALPAFRGECEPSTYACRIAIRAAVVARRRARLSRARHEDTEADHVAGDASPGDEALASRRKEILRGLLEEIPEEQAEALAMRSVLGWSLEEIAASASAPLNTIRSRLRLAKEALRRKIESVPGLADELGVAP